LLSIVGAVQIGAEALRQDVPLLLYLLAAINMFVGIVNLFPMLPLDGGHVVIAVYERIRSKRGRPYHADVTKLMPVAYVFLLFVVVIGLGALYMNIIHPAQLPGG
jgi:membrane-associated protease RseP (regulator of RpoE activity)